MLRGSSSASSEPRRSPEFSAGSRDASHYFYLDRSADVLAEIKRFYSTLR